MKSRSVLAYRAALERENMRTIHCTAKDPTMSKKQHNPFPTKPFPEDRHVMTQPQREVPNPAIALADAMTPLPSERAHLRAASVCQERREARARREALAILEREDARRDAISRGEVPAPTVREDLQATRLLPLDAPMATWVGDLPDPFAQQNWGFIAELFAPALPLWERIKVPAAFTLWSVGCFLLGMLL